MGRARKVYFPEQRIQLYREVTNHPDLMVRLLPYKGTQMEEVLGEIAAYVGVILDGYYEEDRINELCDILTEKLKDKRKIIIAS